MKENYHLTVKMEKGKGFFSDTSQIVTIPSICVVCGKSTDNVDDNLHTYMGQVGVGIGSFHPTSITFRAPLCRYHTEIKNNIKDRPDTSETPRGCLLSTMGILAFLSFWVFLFLMIFETTGNEKSIFQASSWKIIFFFTSIILMIIALVFYFLFEKTRSKDSRIEDQEREWKLWNKSHTDILEALTVSFPKGWERNNHIDLYFKNKDFYNAFKQLNNRIIVND
jgi:hypothetical protein